MFNRRPRIVAVMLTALLSFCAYAGFAGSNDGAHALAEKIARAHQLGQKFTEASLFAPAHGGSKHLSVLDAETLLQPLNAQVVSLFNTHPDAVSISFKTEAGASYILEMLRSFPTGESPDMGVYDAEGRHRTSYQSGLHYQGAIAGDGNSIATMSVFANGEVVALFSNAEGNFVLGRLEDNSGNYIFYNDRDLHGRPMTPCATLDPPPGITSQDITHKATRPLLCNKVRVYWEVANKLYVAKGSSLTTTQNYATALFNQFQAMYANEKIAMELSSLYVWTTADDYPINTSQAALYAFRAYWNGMNSGFNGDVAHLLTKSGNNLGGVAFVDVLCSPGSGYGFSDVSGLATIPAVPTYSWDVEVVTHETGHNLGSKHTHWCGWMTGSGGTCGAIDNCYTLETTSSCSSCSATNLNSAPTSAWQGTVMSYCHLVSRGINLANGFGPLPGNVIRTNVAASSCLFSTINASLTATPVCKNDGTVTLTLAANNLATPPYTYTWSNNAHTQNLTGLATSGIYSVNLSDSNGCTQTFSVNVPDGRSAGTAANAAIHMPVCCNKYNAPLVLNASVPQGLSSCHTIKWLRSKSAITSNTAAKAYFDTAAAANVLNSANAGSIANGATGASVAITPEACTTQQTYYYTPVVVRLQHTADSFTYSSTGSTAFTPYGGIQIGAWVSIPDQTTLPNNCDLLDTSVSKTLSVTVTGYTGRANKMRITVTDVNHVVLYQSPGYTGNGTYSIPASAITGDFLQGLLVFVSDYNCITNTAGTTTSCTTAQANVFVTRKEVFGNSAAAFANDCALSPSVKVDFAPTACTQLSVAQSTFISGFALVPNPATSSVRLEFNLGTNNSVRWTINDITGKLILNGAASFAAGTHTIPVDLSQLARGVYIVNMSDTEGMTQRAKLIVE